MSNTHSSNAMDDVLPTNRHSGETTAIDTPVPTTLTIWCFIRGEGAPFRVTIARTHIVDDLKKAIYNEKKTLQFTDANLLTLYEINLPIDENLPKIVEDMKLGPLRPLMVTKRLSQVFPAVPKDDTVHILVQLPELAPVSHAMVKDGSGPSSGASGSKHSHSGDIDMGVAAPLLAQAIRRSGSGNKSGGSTRLSGEMMETGMTQTSSGVVRTRDEEEATDQLRPLSKKPKRKVDQTSKLLARWRQPIDVPDVVTLLKHLQTPLSEEEKVPVSQEQFDHLVTTYNPDAPKGELGAEKVAALFRVNEEEEADSIHILLAYVLGWTPQTSGTESAFHAIWDVNISRIMGTILLDGKFIRDSNQNTNTALKRPDYGFLVRKYCLFWGEEKSPDSSDNPEQELIEKLVDFPYQPLKFILGYYAFGTDVNYVAITHPPVTTEPLFAHNLERKAERLDNLVHLIRLCSALSWMSEQLAPRNNPEFTAIDRPGGVEVTIGVAVKKRFTQPDAVNHVLHLEAIYDLLKKKKVPNTDELVNINTTTDPHIMTKPVGVDCVPHTRAELFQAAICVLQALKVMHAEPEPVYHRDIRQPNILRRRDQEGWFLIDWSDASKTPTKASTTLLKRSHSPRVFEDDHGGEVDVWGVGCYLHEYAYRCKATEPEKIREISRRWMANYTITAAAALDELETSEHFFTTNPQHGTSAN